MKIFWTVVITVAVIVGGWLLVAKLRGGMTPPPQPPSVRIERVGRGELIETVSAPGVVQPRTKVQISARVAARIQELPFKEGQHVTKGDPSAHPPVAASILVKLDATDLEAELRGAQARADGQRASLAEAEARIRAEQAQNDASAVMLKDADRDLSRQKQLLETHDVSQSVVDQAQAKYDQLRLQLESSRRSEEADKLNLIVLRHQIDAADADIAQARDNLSYTTIVSPIDGIVTRVNAKAGEMVVTGTMNNAGTVIMEVSDLSQMQVDAQIDESNIASVHPGQKATVRISAYPNQLFDGIVKLVGLDVADDQQGRSNFNSAAGKYYKARIALENNKKPIALGLSADVDIQTNVHRNVIKVPSQAVFGKSLDELPDAVKNKPEVDKNKTIATVVFVYKAGKLSMTPVTIGASDMTHTIITSGLNVGDQVVIGPYKALPGLSDGEAVREEPATSQPTSQPATQPTAQPIKNSATQSTTKPATTRSD